MSPRNVRNGSSAGSKKAPFGIRSRHLLLAFVLSLMVGTSTFLSTRMKAVWPQTFDEELFEDAPSIIVTNKEVESEDASSTIAVSKEPVDAIDWNDKIFRREAWDNDPVVIESHKLLFFTVPKNSCSTFKMLFRRMMGYQNWFKAEPHDPSSNGLRYLGHYSLEQQIEFVTSPDWTRAIFVRDPLERALSAYMDKALHTFKYPNKPWVEGAHVKNSCCGRKSKIPACREFPLSPWENPLTIENFPFESFAKSLMTQCNDPHWAPQALRMRKQNWKMINFVGHFENIQGDTRRLLERIGAYEEFGRTGWGEGSNKNASIFERNIANHKTGSGNKMKHHYTPELQRLVMEHYRLDYDSEVFNITKPFD